MAGHKLEAEAGATMLEQGGNAYDALVASVFMGFVVEQIDCGLGGFAHVSVRSNTNKNFYEIDGYVTAPLKSHEAMFEIDDDISYYGHPFTKNDAAKLRTPISGLLTSVGKSSREALMLKESTKIVENLSVNSRCNSIYKKLVSAPVDIALQTMKNSGPTERKAVQAQICKYI